MTEDIRIIRQVINGQADSFKFLVEKYQRPVVRMIRNMINDGHLAEDLGQEVFFTAYKKLASFDPARSNFSTWLLTIAKNKSLNAVKKKRPLSLGQLPEKADSHNPGDNLAEKEFFAELDEALQALPRKQRMAFIMAAFEELPYEEIAQIEGVKIGTVKSRINRARKKLRSRLVGHGGDTI